MKYLVTLIAACTLLVGVSVAQQYPTTSQPYPQQQQQPYPQDQTSQTGPYSNAVIPAGTELQIRTNENIQADSQSAGRSYAAEISRDVLGQNGQVLIPKASPAQLTVQNVSAGNMGVGSNEVALALQSVTVNGRTFNVISNTAKQSGDRGIGANKRTAEMTGGGAVLGTVIGAVAGGAKGAVIGAIAGAGAGATAQVLTRGKEVKVPAETLMTFRLDQPLTLQ